MATTITTALDGLKLALRDRGGQFLSDAEYEQCLLVKITPESTYQAIRVTAGYWTIPTTPLCLFAASFSEQPGASYELCCGGFTISGTISIKLTAGADLRTEIDVTGCMVDFNEAVADLLVFIANHRAQEYAQSIGGGSMNPTTARRELLEQASVIRGVKAV